MLVVESFVLVHRMSYSSLLTLLMLPLLPPSWLEVLSPTVTEDRGGFDDEKKWRLIGALLASRSRYAGVLVNDLTGGRERINSPGTVGPDNWSYRFPRTAGEFADDPVWERWVNLVESSGRG